jgi:hypothetical protein
MDRKTFIKILSPLPVAGVAMKLNELNKITEQINSTDQMTVGFGALEWILKQTNVVFIGTNK